MRIATFTFILLILSLSGYCQVDSSQNKSGLRKWIDRRNERLDRAAEQDNLEYQRSREKRRQRSDVKAGYVNMQNDIDQAKRNEATIRRAGYAFKSGGGFLLGGLLVGIGGSAIGSALNDGSSTGKMNTGRTVVISSAVLGTILTIIGGAEIIRGGNILTDYSN